MLASSSPYRRAALAKLELDFTVASPDIDESPRPSEAPQALSERLALAKAQAVQAGYPDAIVIGSDQVGFAGQSLLGKPGSRDAAVAQLTSLAGQEAAFYTALAVCAPDRAPIVACDVTRLEFRRFTKEEARAYVELDDPVDCAGGFKVESLGIALFERIESEDPTALIGLPMIMLVSALRDLGINPIAPHP